MNFLEKHPSFPTLIKNQVLTDYFPNQDFHSGKGLGNLIALPLNGKALIEWKFSIPESGKFLAIRQSV